MTNDELPEERSLTVQAKAMHRAELLRQITPADRRRRWLLPTAATAAAVAVVAVAGAVLAGGDDPGSRPVDPAGGASSTSSKESPNSDSASPDQPSASIRPGRSGRVPLGPRTRLRSESCSELRMPVAGAREISSVVIGRTTVRLYSNSEAWIVCDEWAALDGGPATLLHPHRFGSEVTKEQLGISMNFSMDDPDVGEYVAGGALPEDVAAITYTFADGHVEQATTNGEMWAIAYFTSGRDVHGDATVEVAMRNGSVRTFTLRFPEDFCSQSNHGC